MARTINHRFGDTCSERHLDAAEVGDGDPIPEMERRVLSWETDIEPLYHGSGMGLWLVDLIVRQSDGVLSFEENDPSGNVVTIRLPSCATDG